MENKKIKRIIARMALLLTGILMIGVLGGCTSDKSVRTYLQALLDASYKNDPTAFMAIKLGSAEDAQALYEQGIDVGVSVFCSRLGMSDVYEGEYRQVYMDMLSKVRYTVEDAERQTDGSYVVTVTYLHYAHT